MYTLEQLESIVLKNDEEISAIRESVKSAHHRIDENKKLADSVHELAQNIAVMSMEIKMLTERFNASVEKLENSLQAQSERITNVEKTIMSIDRNKDDIKDMDDRLKEIEKQPASKWNKLTWLLISGVVSAVIGFLVATLNMGAQ